VKGDIGACELPSEGAGTPIRRMAATNRRWVTAGTPPQKTGIKRDSRSKALVLRKTVGFVRIRALDRFAP